LNKVSIFFSLKFTLGTREVRARKWSSPTSRSILRQNKLEIPEVTLDCVWIRKLNFCRLWFLYRLLELNLIQNVFVFFRCHGSREEILCEPTSAALDFGFSIRHHSSYNCHYYYPQETTGKHFVTKYIKRFADLLLWEDRKTFLKRFLPKLILYFLKTRSLLFISATAKVRVILRHLLRLRIQWRNRSTIRNLQHWLRLPQTTNRKRLIHFGLKQVKLNLYIVFQVESRKCVSEILLQSFN